MKALNSIGINVAIILTVLFSICLSSFAEDSAAETGRARMTSDASPERTADLERLNKRMSDAKLVFKKLVEQPDGGIPEKLLKRSDCIAILPDVLKAAFVVGGEFGKGVLSCRTKNNVWSAPSFVELRAASFGWQIGGQSTDLVMFFAGEKAKQVLTTNKFTLGADIGVTAGPVGRQAEGSLGDNMEGVYSYAQSEGIFAGLALNGAEILPDKNSNQTYYSTGGEITNIVLDDMPTNSLPQNAREFIASLPQ